MRNFISILILVIATLFVTTCSNNPSETDKTKTPASEETDTLQTEVENVQNQSAKAQLLQSIVGKQTIQSVNGFYGANTMLDIYQENENWVFGGSANEGGVREGFENNLTEDQIRILNTLQIVVMDDLSVSILCNESVFTDIPFDETKMDFHLNPAKEYAKYGAIPENLSKNNSYIDGIYYLVARDNFENNELSKLDPTGYYQPDFLCLTLSEKTKKFELSLRMNDCCDVLNFTFK